MRRLSADEFLSGLLAALALKGFKTISLRDESFDRSLARVFVELQGMAADKDLDLQFRIRVHPIHGDSETVRHAISEAAQRGIISLDNPEYQDLRIKLTATVAESILGDVPGGKGLFTKLADAFLRLNAFVPS